MGRSYAVVHAQRVNLVLAAALLAYAVLTWSAPHRAVMLALVPVALASTLAVLGVAPRLRGRALDNLLAGWALSRIAIAATAAECDGGLTSPWLSMLLVAVAYASVALPIRYLGLIVAGDAVALFAVGYGDDQWVASVLVRIVALGAIAGLAAGAISRLRRSELLWRSSFEAAAVSIAVTDSDGLLVDVNPRFCEWLGYPRDALAGTRMEEIVHPEDAAAHRAQVRAIASAGQSSYDADRRLRTADGRWVWAQVSASTIQTATGEARLLAQLMDITERKRDEDELRASVAELSVVEDVRAALREDRLVLYAQPICSLPDRTVVRHELLVRMIDHDGQLVPPGSFLPAAERHGAIADIDRWVIARAIEVARAGQAVNVNISALSLTDPYLLDPAAEAVGRGLDPQRLAFEITETAMAADLAAAVAFAERAGALGFGVAIDDFGVGFGSLTYVQQLPNVGSLKIDRAFIAQLADREADQRIVTAVVQLAMSMRHTTVAEGIEDERALAAAAQLGVGFGQGFLLGRPHPVHEIFEVALAC